MKHVETINQIIEEQNETFIDRKKEILLAWLATLAGEHVFYLGLPGTGKSMLSNDMTQRIVGATVFSYLMMKDTTRSEIFGPPDIAALKEGKYRYITTRKLPEAHNVFLDEIWKSSSAVINTLLTALNERKFDDGEKRRDIPLITVYSASNELPQGKELQAAFDRFVLRYEVRDLEDDGDFFDLLNLEPEINVQTTLTLKELREAQTEAIMVDIPEDILHKVVELRRAIQEEGLWGSPRRWRKGLKVVRALAYINGRKEASEDDLEVYQHMLWDTLEEAKKARKAVLGTINPMNVRVLELVDQAEEAYRDFKNLIDRGTDNETVQSEAMQHNQNLMAVKKELTSMGKSLPKGTMKDRVVDAYKKVKAYHKFVTSRGLGIGDDEEEM